MAIRLHQTAAPCLNGGAGLLLGLLAPLISLTPATAGGAGAASNQPVSIPPGEQPAPPCPLLVPPELPALQPLRIHPSQVAAKNRRGCLSAADAIYGTDGCPRRLCGNTSGAFNLPPGP